MKRQSEGTPTGGQFAPDRKAEPNSLLSNPPARPVDGSLDIEFLEARCDLDVGDIFDGKLSRGVVNQADRDAFARMHASSRGPWRDGLESGMQALYGRRADGVEAQLEASGKKRTNAQDREGWRLLLKHAPSEAHWRGHMAAAMCLNGDTRYNDYRPSTTPSETIIEN